VTLKQMNKATYANAKNVTKRFPNLSIFFIDIRVTLKHIKKGHPNLSKFSIDIRVTQKPKQNKNLPMQKSTKKVTLTCRIFYRTVKQKQNQKICKRKNK
jgi:hypothetical protein